MKWIFLLVIFIGIVCLTVRSENIEDNPLSFNEPDALNLNGTWDFKYIPSATIGSDSLFYTKNFDVSGWANIQVPGNWELQGFAEPSYGTVKTGTGLYRRTFTLPDEFKNRQIFIQFDGVLYGYDVFVNGKYAGNWTSSFNAASFNITDFVNFSEENLLAVRVSTNPRGFAFDVSDCWGLSGIFRDVKVFSTPDSYINDYTVQTLINKDKSAFVKVSVELNSSDNSLIANSQIKGELQSPEGKIIRIKNPVKKLSGNELLFKVKLPDLWTAETPLLYNLKLLLIQQDGQVVQEKNQAVGIREITIDQAIMKLNGSPLKLRGVNHHDLVPATGRAMSREQILNDLILMKKANINFIRTSHYPPDYKLLDLCDSLGFYVDCEVPFNYGSKLLLDTANLDLLLKRAWATLYRDKNHPGIIFWSLGNEDPCTPITEATGRYVKKLDQTRPICYPGLKVKNEKHPERTTLKEPDFAELISAHYKKVDWIVEKTKTTTKPIVLTEYAHAMGTAFGNMEDVWGEMFRNPKMVGGAVWHFQDQGIYRKADKPVDTHKLADYVWLDSLSYFDTYLTKGADGIVYSDRTPQVDYWQVRKVYSPVQIIDPELPIVPGVRKIGFQVYNQYDFLNLNILQGKWELLRNRSIIQAGELNVNCAPHDTILQELTVVLPEDMENDTWLLRLMFHDKTGMPVYEHAIRLLTEEGLEPAKDEIHLPGKSLEIRDDEVVTGNYNFNFSKKDFSVQLTNEANQNELIVDGLYVRTGREGTIKDKVIQKKFSSEIGDYPWNPYLLPVAEITSISKEQTEKTYCLSGEARFLKGENFPGQSIAGNIAYKVESDGVFTVSYDLVPENTTGIMLEAGISFRLSEKISDFIWLGDGPFASCPDKHLLNDFGVHYLKKGDLNFNGNRANVELAVLTDVDGNGIAIIGDRSNISVELINGQIVVSHNALVGGRGNGTSLPLPDYLLDAAKVTHISGLFQIVPLQANHWPKKLIEILGGPDKTKKPFAPFYYCYDWSK